MASLLSLSLAAAVALAGCAAPSDDAEETAAPDDRDAPAGPPSAPPQAEAPPAEAAEPLVVRGWCRFAAGAGGVDDTFVTLEGQNALAFRVPDGYAALVADLYWNDTAEAYGFHLEDPDARRWDVPGELQGEPHRQIVLGGVAAGEWIAAASPYGPVVVAEVEFAITLFPGPEAPAGYATPRGASVAP